MLVIYLKEDLDEKLRELRSLTRKTFAPFLTLPNGNLSDDLNDRNLNTLALNFACSQIMSDPSYFQLFINAVETKEDVKKNSKGLIKEYFYDSFGISKRIYAIERRYVKRTGKFMLYLKFSKVIHACLTTLFKNENSFNFLIYMSIFLYGKRTEILTPFYLKSVLFDTNTEEDLEVQREITKQWPEGEKFIIDGYNFALQIIENVDAISNEAKELLKRIYSGQISNIILFTEKYLEIFKNLRKPSILENRENYGKAIVISGIVISVIESIEFLSYQHKIVDEEDEKFLVYTNESRGLNMNNLLFKLKEEGIDLTSKNNFIDNLNDPKTSQMVQSLLKLVEYSMFRMDKQKIEILPLTIKEVQSEE